MSKEDTGNGGLFSKVVKFVRNPATNWADLDQKEADRESTYTKQALKEMIERKRRNDFVRKREFDMLRKMRRREAMAGTDGTQRPSFFQSSLPSKPDDRAMTLKKIDEIEAQMSMQWWKTKHADSSMQTSGFAPSLAASTTSQTESKPLSTAPMSAAAPVNAYSRPSPAPTSRPELPPLSFSDTAPPPLVSEDSPRKAPPSSAPASRQPARAPAKPVAVAGLSASYDGGPSGFTASNLVAVEVGEVAHDAELEEASIRFANGDDAAAEAGLREALAQDAVRADHVETWLTLFDLFRATGQQESFEAMAIDFAGRFGRSAPVWFSIPEMISRMAAPAPAAAERPSDWNSPASLGTQSLVKLGLVLAKAKPPWTIDWGNLKTIEEMAIEPLRRLLSTWADQPVKLRFLRSAQLARVLKDATPSGQKSVSQEWWKLRLAALRVMHRPDEFELVALDYCVTYEVSPPSWDPARCEYKTGDAEADQASASTLIGEVYHDSVSMADTGNTFGDTLSGATSSQMTQMAAIELAGQIQGDATAVMDKLESRLGGADIMVISCSKLIRVDFSAAGTLLNWVTTQQTQGRIVQFNDVHRLVAAFFHVIGISEHAKISPRRD